MSVLQCGNRTTLQHTVLPTHTHNSKRIVNSDSQIATTATSKYQVRGFERALTAENMLISLRHIKSKEAAQPTRKHSSTNAIHNG